MPDSLAAIILAGGASRRMGRDKAGIRLDDGQTLLERTIAGVVRAGATEVVVAGDDPDAPDAPDATPSVTTAAVTYVREDPPLSGPVPALDAALERVSADVVLVLPCDLAEPATAATHLVAAASGLVSGRDGLVAVDASGHRQHLTALFRTAALRAGSTAGVPGTDGRVRTRVAGLDLVEVPEPAEHPGLWADMDTPEDLAWFRARTPTGMDGAAGNGGQEHRAGQAGRIPESAASPAVASGIPGLEPWLHAAARTLDLPESAVVTRPLLDMARDVAHGVIRPGAPTTTYLIGLVVGRALADGATPEEADRLTERLASRIRDLVLDYDPAEGDRP